MWGRMAIRRCLYTFPPRPQPRYNLNRLRLTLGISVVAATYLTWRLTSDKHLIALDGPSSPSSPTQPSSSPKSALSNPSRPRVPTSDSTPSPSHTESEYETRPPSKPDSVGSTEDSSVAKNDDGDVESSDKGEGGAFNPVTGEINWDCPCLGGMAHGPCGLEFREAFSCFVYSEDEPKGNNCIEKFKAMQDCFRAHPDIYAEEIMDDDDNDDPGTLEEEGKKDVALSTKTKVDQEPAGADRTKSVNPEPPTTQSTKPLAENS